jgi:hypothetical protein
VAVWAKEAELFGQAAAFLFAPVEAADEPAAENEEEIDAVAAIGGDGFDAGILDGGKLEDVVDDDHEAGGGAEEVEVGVAGGRACRLRHELMGTGFGPQFKNGKNPGSTKRSRLARRRRGAEARLEAMRPTRVPPFVLMADSRIGSRTTRTTRTDFSAISAPALRSPVRQ